MHFNENTLHLMALDLTSSELLLFAYFVFLYKGPIKIRLK